MKEIVIFTRRSNSALGLLTLQENFHAALICSSYQNESDRKISSFSAQLR